MPRRRFDWGELPESLLRRLNEELTLGGRRTAQVLARRYGARFTEKFVKDA